MNASTISEKIKNSLEILIEMRGISEAELCRKTNISQATLWRLFNGNTDPRASTLNAIAAYFNITVDQLIGNQPITKGDQGLTSGANNVIFIPVFSLEKPVELTNMLGKVVPNNWSKWLDVEPTVNKLCFAVEVMGESMWPLFLEGTMIIVDPILTPKNKNYVLCKQHKTNEIIFRQYLEENGEKLLKPVNYAFKTIPLQKDDLIIGIVIQSRNKFVD